MLARRSSSGNMASAAWPLALGPRPLCIGVAIAARSPSSRMCARSRNSGMVAWPAHRLGTRAVGRHGNETCSLYACARHEEGKGKGKGEAIYLPSPFFEGLMEGSG